MGNRGRGLNNKKVELRYDDIYVVDKGVLSWFLTAGTVMFR